MLSFRISPRLPHFDYRGSYAYFFTMMTRQRRPVFRDAEVVHRAVEALKRAAVKHGFDVQAYCFMPDHLHLLVSGRTGASATEFARHFKQLSSFDYKQRHGTELWQISYYDRVLRQDEDLHSVARYIWGNPVSAGVAVDPRTYKFSGPRPLPADW